MLKDAQKRIIFVLRAIEVTIAILLTIAIVILCLPMIPAIFDLLSPGADISDLKIYVGICLFSHHRHRICQNGLQTYRRQCGGSFNVCRSPFYHH